MTIHSQQENTAPSIFVVEDEGIIAHSIAATLEKAGYQVAGIAGSGEEALSKLSEIQPQLILMDIHLNGRIDGIELSERVRELFEIPIVYLTAHSDKETLNRAKITSPFGYLPKPVQQNNLFTSIEIALFKHRVESELRQQRAWLNTVLNTMGDGVIVTGNGGAVQFLNPQAERLTGWLTHEAKGEPVARILPLIDRSLELSLDTLILDSIAKGFPTVLPSDLHTVSLSGVTFPIDGEIAPSIDERGAVGAVITFRSASLRLKEEGEIRHDHKMLAVGRLAAGVAHDFNNLLTVVLGTAEMALATLPAGSQLCNAMHQIIQAGETAADVTRKLLTFSSKHASAAQNVDLNTIISTHEGLCRHLLGSQISWSCTLAPGLGLVRADPTELAEVLMNLVTNARDAMPDGGHLMIQTKNVDLETHPLLPNQNSRYIALIVEDNGKGMDATTAEHLFEPFFTTKFAGKGTGLGLSIVDGIVRDIGGNIDVDSEPGLGTTFTVYFPRAAGAGPTLVPALENVNSPVREKTLLVVDDDHAVRRILLLNLQDQGYKVLEAECGSQALRIAEEQQGRIDLLITDVMMPDMNGPQLSAKLQALYPGLKTMFVTGFSGDLLRDHDLPPDETSLLRKPFRQTQLLEKVNKLLSKGESIAHHSS